MTHARVNAELNRLSGSRRVAQATAPELGTARAANRWLAEDLSFEARRESGLAAFRI